jgi:hypothetical protein
MVTRTPDVRCPARPGPRTRRWPVPAWTVARAAAGVAVRRTLGRLSVRGDVASLLLDER